MAQILSKYILFINEFYHLIFYPIGLLVAFFLQPNLEIGWQNMGLLLVGSIIFPLVSVLSFKASKNVDAGLYTILTNLLPIVTITFAYFLLNETLNSRQLFGAGIIIFSTFLITIPSLFKHSKNNVKSICIALFAIFILGLGLIFERWMLTRIDFGAYLVFGWGSQTLWMSVFAWKDLGYIKILKNKKYFIKILTYSLASALGGLCYLAAVKLSGNVALVGSYISFLPILVVLAAFFILKEKDWFWLKICSALIGTIGLIIICFS